MGPVLQACRRECEYGTSSCFRFPSAIKDSELNASGLLDRWGLQRYRPTPTPAQFASNPDLISKATVFLRREFRVWSGVDVEASLNLSYHDSLFATLPLTNTFVDRVFACRSTSSWSTTLSRSCAPSTSDPTQLSDSSPSSSTSGTRLSRRMQSTSLTVSLSFSLLALPVRSEAEGMRILL
jgi:hypothetical protein